MALSLTRRGFCAALAWATFARPAWAQSNDLTARATTLQLAPDGYPATQVWTYDGSLPGPTLRLMRGERLTRRLVNELPEPTSIHWHGIRIDNAMDGVAGLTQDAVPPGGTFDYDFALPDAGTYWYHAHNRSFEQVARGLAGPLIVDETTPLDVDRDEVLMLGDWLLNPETGAFAEPFDHPMMLSHGGRMGNLIGTNGRHDLSLPCRQSDRMRLRLINAATARIFVLALDGMTGWQVALDGMPLEAPEPVTGALILAPAQRIDLIVDITAEDTATLVRNDDDDQWRPQVLFPVSGSGPMRSDAPGPLPPNPGMDIPDLTSATRLELLMEGGAMAGMESARFEGQDMGFRDLVQRGRFWALSGQVGMTDDPFARLSRGEPVRLTLTNRTAFPHAMHLHGMHFRQIAADGTPGAMRDTILSIPQEPLEIALIADNPGKWLLHCHMLGHAASGMTTWVEIA